MSENQVTDESLRQLSQELIQRHRNELFLLTEEDLMNRWFFRWDEKRDVAWNLYQFSDHLERYKRDCRDWEIYHNGHSMVVERVRDKYIYPKIKAFLADLKSS